MFFLYIKIIGVEEGSVNWWDMTGYRFGMILETEERRSKTYNESSHMEQYKQEFIEFTCDCFVEDLGMLSNAGFYGV